MFKKKKAIQYEQPSFVILAEHFYEIGAPSPVLFRHRKQCFSARSGVRTLDTL